jgi:ligand-binding sensor domain-containing protein/DNA-binding response OmpR family regulator/nitrogen-specific signal transduction histidine kinase
MKRYYLFFVFVFYIFELYPNGTLSSYYFSKIDGENGLSQNNVKAIIQDNCGFMWFGTRNKLNRYDGIAVKAYDCYDPIAKRRDNNISSLLEDDKQQIWVGTDKGIFIFDPVFETFTFFDNITTEGIKIIDWVADITMDLDKNIWIVIPNQGLFKYNTIQKQLYYYSIGGKNLPDQGNPQCICMDKSGKIWIGTNGGGVYLYNKVSDSFTQYLGNKGTATLEGENIYTMCDFGDDLIVGIHEGKLYKLNKRKNILTEVNAPDVHYKIIRHVVCFNDEIWIGTQEGLFIINELKNSVTHLHEDPMYAYALSDNLIGKIYRDKEAGIWIATNFGGVNYLSNKSVDFNRHVPLSRNNSITSKRVRELKEDEMGNIWIATEDEGLNIYNPQDKIYKQLGKGSKIPLSFNKTLGLLLDKNKIWVGFFKNGLDIIELPQYKIRHYSGKELGLNESSIYAICEDQNGKIWIGNGWGVFTGDKNEMRFIRKEQFGLNFIFDIVEDADGYIWVATMGNGVYKYNLKTEQIEHFLHNIEDETSLSSNSVSNITETSDGNIWLSTDRGGICRYNRTENNFTSFSIAQGLPDDVAYKILEDKNRNLWFGTNNGLVKFNPETKTIKVFTKNDGLPGNQFNYKSALATSSGMFYFGGLDGLVEFNPYQFSENTFIPPVYITKLTVFDKEMNLHSEGSPLTKSIIYTDKIVLNHNQSNIRFNFVSLSFTAPFANKYAYMMENIDNDWIYTDNSHGVSYAKLPPGKYKFKVKASNNDGLWNEEGTSIQIEIKPPWYRSKLAYFMYFLISVLIFYSVLHWYKKRNEQKNFEKQRLFETKKEKELYKSKLDFFTNIAHEIRTPLTLINGPLESMMEMEIQDEEITKNLKIMSRNTSELLDLINQLLDFRKVDSDNFMVTFNMTNISSLLRDFYSRFEVSALQLKKKINLTLLPEDVFAPVDRNAITKILNNLFLNAIRYSDYLIEIELKNDDQYFIIIFNNDGQLIPSELKDKIFDPFFQVNRNKDTTSTSGIGLSLARSLVKLHNGFLYYESHDQLNSFVLKLPFNQRKIEKEIPSNDIVIDENDSGQGKHNTEIILIVEDNMEMLNFIADKLKEQFVVEKASNGVEAMKILEEKNADLILTDVMMPEMNGFELCKNVKSKIEYNHIPVVLLTAKNDLDSKIQGLKMGADAYIEKPFSFSYLFTQLNTLLKNRRREKEAFWQKPLLSIQQMGMNKADEEFMVRITNIIEENITDINFNVEHLAEIVHMSRSTLHRKMKVLTDTPPTDFIRLIRLKRAMKYIIEGQYRIGEICYLVGINSPSYFIKLFQKQFGMTPKDFKQQAKKQSNSSI